MLLSTENQDLQVVNAKKKPFKVLFKFIIFDCGFQFSV